MSKFDAATAVDPMEFDLSIYDGPVGVIPEPTNDQIAAFFTSMSAAGAKLGLKPGEKLTPDAMSVIPEDMAEVMMESMLEALVGIGGGSFTADDIKRLPFRIQSAFTAWIAGELNPEAGAPGTKR